jgi:hypothetical protein
VGSPLRAAARRARQPVAADSEHATGSPALERAGFAAFIDGCPLGATVFNSIPYFGPVIVSGGLFLVGMSQDGGLMQALQMAGAALVITSLEGWLVTPPLMGKAERMSALAVFLGLLLWTWIWGAWGTISRCPCW